MMVFYTLLAANPFGSVDPTPGLTNFGGGIAGGGIGTLLSVVLRLLVLIAGIYTLLQLIFAGFGFISAGGDPKAVEMAWAKIWQSLVGLTVIAGSFVLAAIFGYLLFGDANAILTPSIIKP